MKSVSELLPHFNIVCVVDNSYPEEARKILPKKHKIRKFGIVITRYNECLIYKICSIILKNMFYKRIIEHNKT